MENDDEGSIVQSQSEQEVEVGWRTSRLQTDTLVTSLAQFIYNLPKMFPLLSSDLIPLGFHILFPDQPRAYGKVGKTGIPGGEAEEWGFKFFPTASWLS